MKVLCSLSFIFLLIINISISAQTWTAYNDCVTTSGQHTTANTTTITYNGSGTLKKQADGSSTGITAAFTSNGTISSTTNGVDANSETDAYNTFYPYSDMAGVVNSSSSNWWINLTLTGLDPTKTYTFAGTTVRDGGYTTRNSTFILSGDDMVTNASSSGVTVVNSHTIAFNTGTNKSQGYIVRWTGINPGSDGTIVIRTRASLTSEISGSSTNAYGLSVFMLQEETSTSPTINTTGTLTPFSSLPGTPSAEQNYTVSGINLTDNIIITPPADFELSLTSGSGFSTSPITLTPAGGSVSATTVYVRFNRLTEGTSSGNITNTSTGALTKNVAVNGTAEAPLEIWSAYNDCITSSGQHIGTNVTTITLSGSGELIDQNTGRQTGVNVSLTQSGGVTEEDTYGEDTDAGTDAYDTFFAYTDLAGNMHYGSSGWYALLTFSGLDPNKTYTFITTANRNNSDYTSRISKFTISDIDAANNSSTSGVTVNSNFSVSFCTGYNTTNGYVARWTNIQPGTDGDFIVRVEADGSEYRAYGFSVFMLKQESDIPTINTTGTLTPFSSQPGVPSAEQNYTVSGTNLTDNILITAPTDFEISTTSGSGFGYSLTLTQSSGTVASTTIYVRFNRSTAGSSSGDIAHISSGAITYNVAISGTASTGWTAYNDGAYIDGQISTNITTYECYTNNTTGLLKKYSDGSNSAVTVLVTTSGTVESQLSSGIYGAEPNLGTDAYTTFHGFVNMVGGMRLGTSSSYVDLTFTGLDPAKTYTFISTANRDSSSYTDRFTKFTISDIDAATNSSTSGVTVNNNLSVSFCTGYNRVNGYVARWVDIQPGSDGDFKVRFEVNSGTYAYGPAVFLLQEGSGSGPINQAPDQPELIQPTNNQTEVTITPTLEVMVNDPDNDMLNVTFYGRAVGTSTPGEDFTLVVIPDPQNYATSYPPVYTNHLQWIADNKTNSNIVFATSVGDLVNTPSSSTEYTNADNAFNNLDEGNVSYSVGPGNHDMMTGSLWATYFGASRFSEKSYYGASYDNYNSYSLFSASGMDFIIINLQYSPSTEILNWADARLKQFSSRRAIVEQHDILNTNDSWVNQASYTALKDNLNLFLMLCGHMHSANDGAAYRSELGDDGHTIHIVMADYQDFAGSGYLRILRFSPVDNKIYMSTFSPISGFTPITTSPDQMEMVYSMSGNAAAFEIIGTVNDVTSGSNASISWPGELAYNTEYDWYTTASDGSKTTTSPTWSFITGEELPVELSSFSALVIGSSVKLAWETATEVNNYGFEIERKVGSGQSPVSNYEKIGFVNGNGNSNSPKNYGFEDKTVIAGKYSYRLKQIDNDGQFEYSKTIEADLGTLKNYELTQNYPNPFNPTTTIRFSIPEAGNVKLTLYNILGQEVRTLLNEVKEIGVHAINFDASNLNSGMYIYKIEAGSFTQARKMTLVK